MNDDFADTLRAASLRHISIAVEVTAAAGSDQSAGLTRAMLTSAKVTIHGAPGWTVTSRESVPAGYLFEIQPPPDARVSHVE